MAELMEIIREDVGKSSNEMKKLFQQMIAEGELKAYDVKIDKKIVEKDTKYEKIVRTIKGATLTPITKLGESPNVILEYPATKTKYNLNINSRGGTYFNDGDSQTMYHTCDLERLADDFDTKKLEYSVFYNKIKTPDEMITGKLHISYNEDLEFNGRFDEVVEIKSKLIVNGEPDELFEKVCDYVRSE